MKQYKIPFFYFLIILFFQLPVISQSIDGISDDDPEEREVELGLRVWKGYHSKDRFEGDLSRYKSVPSNNIFSYTSMEPFRYNDGLEIFGKYRLFKNWKAALFIGNGKFRNFKLLEYDSTNTFTNWNMKLSSDYVLIGGYYEWFFKKFTVEFGAFMGINTTALEPSGYTSTLGRNISNSGGVMTASGLSYRLEGNINKQVSERIWLQIGIAGTWHTAPGFNGSLNDRESSLFLRSDGTVGYRGESDGFSSLLGSEIAVRRLDMFYGSFQIHKGITTRIQF